jgi:DNA-binding transcriptional MerR regulator
MLGLMRGDWEGRFTTGDLARCAGVTARTVRWYTEQGLLSAVCRSRGGYRLYDAAALARLELVRTLREMGLELPVIRKILDREVELCDVAAVHADAVEAQIRALRLRHAVLRAVAARGSEPEEAVLMHRLARLSAQERRRVVDDFLDDVFARSAADPEFEAGMRSAVPELPDEPSAAQVEAWVELAELTGDPDFRRRVRAMAQQVARWPAAGGSPHAAIARAAGVVLPEAGAALDAGLDPAAPEGAAVAARIAVAVAAAEGASDSPAFRARLAGRLEIVADPRVERYWQLVAVIEGTPGPGASVPRLDWAIAALRDTVAEEAR